jgi:ring-1,2-phenylacetyl-CoA epoxidase subunit PaaC
MNGVLPGGAQTGANLGVIGEAAAGTRGSLDEAALDPATRAALIAYVQAIGDDEFLLGHRDSEWTGLGPILEEDIAFSSMAQDELGHALVWYKVLHQLGAPEPDAIAFLRDAPDWRNAVLVELPRGDYAYSLVRQYLFDLTEAVRYDALAQSPWAPMAEAAVKLRQEEKYHLIHGRTLVERLGRAGGEGRARLQAALDALFPYALGLWESPAGEERLVAAGIVADSETLRDRWLGALAPFLIDVGLVVPAQRVGDGWRPTVAAVTGGRRGEHTAHLPELLLAMQGLYRSDPVAVW